MNFVQTIVFCIGPMTAFADHMECYECTWDAYHKVDSAARKQKQKELQDFGKMSYPLKWMLPNSTFFGNEAISTYPEKADLERLCSKCSLGPSTVCVKWKFFTSVKNNPLNVTWGCVSSVERGCFEEKAAKDLYKEVCLCDSRHLCNSALALRPRCYFLPTYIYLLLTSLAYQLFIYFELCPI
ncbi:uncharacterized protein LOC111272417 [Varroa jacobsoni]|uniref:uncharacterized protein LOC111272417 n=1 Tax=Varroa jacobsoni TaxID=62625 RepID=UPI000BF682B7|nr:uncharacterized protein LOC111272417 [Varroa jacobsoni]